MLRGIVIILAMTTHDHAAVYPFRISLSTLYIFLKSGVESSCRKYPEDFFYCNAMRTSCNGPLLLVIFLLFTIHPELDDGGSEPFIKFHVVL